MGRRVQMSISDIHNNWVAVQKLRLAKLSRISPVILSESVTINKSQAKQVCFHVFVRGYNSYTLFYDNEDRVHFLSILDDEAQKKQATILAFILMDNHFHLQVVTYQLGVLMKNTLSRYSSRFRRKYGLEGAVFKKMFGRSQIFSHLLAKENLLYILSNASRENICVNHREYIWSSYHSHPEVIQLRKNGFLSLLGENKVDNKASNKLDNRPLSKVDNNQDYSLYNNSCANFKFPLPILKRGRGRLPSAEKIAQNDVSRVLKVDTSFMVSAFKSLEDFDFLIHSYEPFNKRQFNTQSSAMQVFNQENSNLQFNDFPKSNKLVRLTPDSEIIDFFMLLLDGRKFSCLSSSEYSMIMKKLKSKKNATYRQIFSIMRVK